MCGIAGIISKKSTVSKKLLNTHNIQKHRGPDDQGIIEIVSHPWTIGLAHQRLSILDLSQAGYQPMKLENGNSWIVYNGEVYNYLEIKAELSHLGHSFNSNSDTEVILKAIHQWGIDISLNKFNGMWAFAYFDSKIKKLFLCRDRFGIKPLHYYIDKEQCTFSSELKTILETSNKKFNLNYQIVGEYLAQSLIETSNSTYFHGILKIPQGHYGVIDLKQDKLDISLTSYWRIPDKSPAVNLNCLVERVRELFIDSVRIRLRSDVPLGILLSGGIDSSAIASAAHHILGQNSELNLLSAVSKDPIFNESPFIDVMCNYLGMSSKKVFLDFSAEEAFHYLKKLSWFNDEPIGGFSNVAHHLLIREAKKYGLTVILSGQGADELLCGYKKYLGFYLQYLVRKKKYAKAIQVFVSFLKQNTIIKQFNFREAGRYLPSFLRNTQLSILGDNILDYVPQEIGLRAGDSVIERQKLDLTHYSIPNLVHFEDRMAMALSAEIRVPFLDYRLVELLINAPIEMKLNQGWTKYVFRKAFEPFLPPEISWRKDKRGFTGLLGDNWLKNNLKNNTLSYFSSDALIFQKNLVNQKNLLLTFELFCKQPLGKGPIHSKEIFNPLALEIWLRQFDQYIA